MCDRRIAKLGVVLLLVVIVVAARPSGEQAAGRVALVVGNSTYAHVGRLPNPGNDAEDVSAALRRLGFEVTTVRDAGRVELNDALRAFTRASAGVDVSLVFYAGHGLEMDGVNYLVPVDARLERDTDVRYETVELDDVLASTDGAELRVVILDACRNNPLARSMQRTGASRSVSRGSFGNLDEALLGDETLVAYSAAAGTTAADGEGRNSPYTSALLAYLEQPLEIGMLFRAVRARVLEETDREQRPHEYASLLGDHYLHAAAPPPVVSVEELPPPVVPVEEPTRAEVVFWESIRESTAPADFEALLEMFPNGTFTRLARNRLVALRAPDPPRTADPPPPVVPVEELPPPVVPVEEPTRAEVVFWESIRESTAPADFEALLEVFPNGTFARLARNRLVALRAPDPPRTDPSPDPPRTDPPPDPPRTDPPPPRPRRAGEVFRDCDGCPEMVVLAGGDLALGQYEVTVGEYRAFASVTGGGAGGGCSTGVNSDSWHDPGFPQTDRHPVTCVSWDDAQEYVSWLSRTAGAAYRLPTEAEWDRAAAGSQAGCYPDRTGNRGTCPVGSYGSNAAGLSDMVGNLWEWTEDCWEGDCSRRVLRGGSWFYVADVLRPGARDWLYAGIRITSFGFRVARTLD